MCCKDKNKDNCVLDMGRGCNFCSCEGEAGASVCEGCFKLHTTDWLEDYPDMLDNDIFEVRFKNTRRSYYRNVNDLDLKKGDIVAVEASPGHDIGIISLTGDMVSRQMKRVGFNPMNGEFKKIYRKAKPYDIEKWQEAIALEHTTMIRSRQIAAEMGLNMKIGDVEYQGDKIKAIFYYIADERVDFRELIKVFADQFRIRVEMKQIGARQEAGRIGGLGSCGRELCCASWISSFVSVTTNAARAQEISLNPQKLAGQCSKLKCCMIYELDTYLDARKEFPRLNEPLYALDGEYHLVKTDILARTMSFSTTPHSMIGLVTLPVSRVREIIALNKAGKKVEDLLPESMMPVKKEEPVFVNVIGEESITRFDNVRSDRKKSRKKKGGTAGGGNGSNGNGSSGRDGNPNRAGGRNYPEREKGSGGRRASGPGSTASGGENAGGQSPRGAEQRGPRRKPAGDGERQKPRQGGERTANGGNYEAQKPSGGGAESNGEGARNLSRDSSRNRNRSRRRGPKPEGPKTE